MFTYDEHLTNIICEGYCFEEKNLVMPHLVNFLAAYEKRSEEEKAEFEEIKPKREYQQQMDQLYVKKGKFRDFHQSQLHELMESENNCRVPHRPQQSNATRKLATYEKVKIECLENIASINRCRDEVNKRIKLYSELLKS